MKFFIEIPNDVNKKKTLHLKQYLEKARIKGLESIEFERKEINEGEMGAGAIGTLSAILIGVARPFSQLVQSFTKYASSFRTEIILKNEFGDELVLNTKKLDEEGITKLVEKFLVKKQVKTTRKRVSKK
jgi:hypothetical protein